MTHLDVRQPFDRSGRAARRPSVGLSVRVPPFDPLEPGPQLARVHGARHRDADRPADGAQQRERRRRGCEVPDGHGRLEVQERELEERADAEGGNEEVEHLLGSVRGRVERREEGETQG